jgi:hypothetical protein
VYKIKKLKRNLQGSYWTLQPIEVMTVVVVVAAVAAAAALALYYMSTMSAENISFSSNEWNRALKAWTIEAMVLNTQLEAHNSLRVRCGLVVPHRKHERDMLQYST